MKYLLLVAFAIVPVSAIFFGGSGSGGGCGGCSSCCPAPPPPCQQSCPQAPICPPQPSCGCGGNSGGFGQGYAQPQIPTCRPRYIIVRPVESYSGGGYSSSGGGYAVSSPQVGPSYSSGPSYSAGPVSIPQASYSAPVQQQASYSAPVQQQASYSAPVQQQSYSAPVQQQASYSAPVQQVAPQASYASGGSSYKSVAATARASKTLIAEQNCNSRELKIILETSIVAGDANESKRRIHAAASEQIRSTNQKGIDVLCAPSKISYRIATDLFCEYTKEDITCFVYQQA